MQQSEQQTETTTTTHTLVKDLDEQARIAYLASLAGKRVRYATTREVTPLQRAFGAYMTMPWLTGRLMALTLMPASIFAATPAAPAIKVERTPTARYLALGGLTAPLEQTIALADLYDIEAQPTIPVDQVFAANQPASAVVAPHSATADPRGFGCEDLFEENEIGCPHCGHKLRVTMQATARLSDDDDEAGETSQP